MCQPMRNQKVGVRLLLLSGGLIQSRMTQPERKINHHTNCHPNHKPDPSREVEPAHHDKAHQGAKRRHEGAEGRAKAAAKIWLSFAQNNNAQAHNHKRKQCANAGHFTGCTDWQRC
jgi:hypothetical protein